MLVPTANKLLFISIALQLYGSNSVKALPPGLDSIHDLRSSLRVRLEPILPLPKPEIPPAPKVPEPAAPVPPSAPGPHVGNPESPPEIPGLVPGRPGSAPPRAPDPAPEGNAGSGCEATKRGLVIRCAGWDKAHDGFVDDAQKRPGVQDDKTLLDLYKSQGKLGTQPIKSGHLDEVKTKYAKGYRTEEDKSDNSLTTGHSEESRIKGLLDQLDIKDVIEKVDFSDFKTYAKLRPKEDSGASPGFSEDYTARNKIGAGDNDVIVLAEENYAKKDTNRFLSDKDNKETQDDVNRAQALYNYDLAMMQMGEKLGGDFNGLGKKFVYHVRANIDNDNTNAFILRLFRDRKVNLDGKVTLNRKEPDDQKKLAMAFMLDQIKSADRMRFNWPEVFNNKDGSRVIEEAAFFAPTEKFDRNGHAGAIVLKWNWG